MEYLYRRVRRLKGLEHDRASNPADASEVPPPPADALAALANAAPPMPGGEYLNASEAAAKVVGRSAALYLIDSIGRGDRI